MKTHEVIRVDNLMYKGCEPHWKCIHCGVCIPFHCWDKEDLEKQECKARKKLRRCKHCLGISGNELGEVIAFCEEWDEWRNVTLGSCFGNCEMEEFNPLTIDQVMEVLSTERKCVLRNTWVGCDRDCSKCDLLMDDREIIESYDRALEILEKYKQEECVDHELHG